MYLTLNCKICMPSDYYYLILFKVQSNRVKQLVAKSISPPTTNDFSLTQQTLFVFGIYFHISY